MQRRSPGSSAPNVARLIFNDRLNKFAALLFMTVVALLPVVSIREWWLVLFNRKAATVHETPFVETAYAP